MRLGRLHLLAAIAALCFVSATATASAAATRFASAGSVDTTGTCAEGAPCRLDHAISGASAGDTVKVAPGDYDITYAVAATDAIHVTGDPAQPRPRLIGDASRTVGTVDMSSGGSIKHVYIESNSAAPALNIKGGLVEGVIAYSPTAAAIRAKSNTGNLTIRNTLAHSASSSAAIVLTDNALQGTLDIANVTAIATGAGSTGIQQGSGAVVTVVNTIARGATDDFRLNGGVLNATVNYSNYRDASATGVTPGLGNQSGAPLFVNAGAGNFREADGSPTINAGSSVLLALGSADLDGNLRIFGSAPDIGAFEFGAGGSSSGGGSGDPRNPVDPDGTGDKTSVLPPAAPPVLGRSVELGAVSGTVTVQLPGSTTRVRLGDGANVPVGSVIDATNGVVSLTSVRDSSGKTQTGQFWGGAFRVTQRRRGDQYTNLQLVGKIGPCGATRGKVTAARHRSRSLWGRDRHGRFRTRGRRGHAIVRGTQWLTRDTCEGTFFKVKQGAIVVRDYGTKRDVTLKRGKSYLAKARSARSRRKR
jgi:hypothetical protein